MAFTKAISDLVENVSAEPTDKYRHYFHPESSQVDGRRYSVLQIKNSEGGLPGSTEHIVLQESVGDRLLTFVLFFSLFGADCGFLSEGWMSPIQRPPISAHFVRFSRFREVVNTSGESQYSQFGSNSVQRPLSSECVYVLHTYIRLSSLPTARMKENCQTIIAVDVQLPLSYHPTTRSNESYPHGITYAMDLDESIHCAFQPLNAAGRATGLTLHSHLSPEFQSTYNRELFAIGAQNPWKITWIEAYENTRDLQFWQVYPTAKMAWFANAKAMRRKGRKKEEYIYTTSPAISLSFYIDNYWSHSTSPDAIKDSETIGKFPFKTKL
ncbi:hypothetical protein CIRG_05771 [Coccidioides immitis RMSCC 2394]|nr:hypothetical protein CIRG_05771 [Coccidioides immitis RMSCC 2394]